MKQEYTELGIKEGYIKISDDGRTIHYLKQNKTYRYNLPEEKVRAEYYIELIKKYQYNPLRIDFEVNVPRRTPNDFADIVIYKDDEKKKPYIVIECKKLDITESEYMQAIEQSFGNANSLRSDYAAVVSGVVRSFFDVKNFPQQEREENIISDIPINYGKIEEFRYKKGDAQWDLKAISKADLIKTLDRCNNIIWDGGKIAPIDAFDELSKILFVKIRDETIARKIGDPYDFQIKTYEKAESVHERILSIYDVAKKKDPEVFTDSIDSDPIKLKSVVNLLQSINFTETDLDSKGVAFEMFMEDFFKGKQGQYFTPREIVSFIISLMELDNDDKVLDPACGSGGFLINSLDYIRNKGEDFFDKDSVDYYRYWSSFVNDKLFGIDINQRISRVAKMNMIIHDDGHTNIICNDSLEVIDKISKINDKFKFGEFDLILTNPPFGAKIEKKDSPYITKYELGKSKNGDDRSTQKSEILFIERCFDFLKHGTGYLGIILPDGILTNLTQDYVRDYIKTNFEIEAIISLPQVTFEHYGAGVKSSVLILRKRYKEEIIAYKNNEDRYILNENKRNQKNYEFNNDVFCAIVDKVGYDSTGREDVNELPNVAIQFKKFKEGNLSKSQNTDNIYIKGIEELNNNRLDAYYYSPKFDKIIEDLQKLPHDLKTLEQVCKNDIECGTTPAKKDYSENEADPKIVKVISLKNKKVDFDLVEHVDPDKISNKIIADKDILLLSSAHSATYLGKNPSIVEIPEHLKLEEIYYVGELMNISVDPNIMNPYYLLQLLLTETYYLLINREKRGQTSHIYPRDIKTIKVPVPDIQVQNKNAENFLKQYNKYNNLIEEAEELMEETVMKFKNSFL